MFTGIVEELGEVISVDHLSDSARIRIKAPQVAACPKPGESIAVNGCCLTVIEPAVAEFSADIMAESLEKTSLGELQPGSKVNLERPMALGDRLGGHLVQGHVDATAVILARTPGDAWEVVRFSLPTHLARYLVMKGSITVDGVSLTVSGLGSDWFEVSLIPTTLQDTVLGQKQVGQRVNLEADMIAKHIEKLLAHQGDK